MHCTDIAMQFILLLFKVLGLFTFVVDHVFESSLFKVVVDRKEEYEVELFHQHLLLA